MIKHIVIICQGIGCNSAVARVAREQAIQLSKYYLVTIISDIVLDFSHNSIKTIETRHTNYSYLKRFAHLPNELTGIIRARRALVVEDRAHSVDMVIAHSHSYLLLSIPKRFNSMLISHGDIFERPKGTYDPLITRLYKITTPRAHQTASINIALSPHMHTCAVKHGANPNTIFLVPNGTDLEYNPRRESFSQNSIRLLYIGRLSPEKNVTTLLDAAKLLADNSLNFSLCIAGSGPDYNALQEKIKKLQLTQCVSLVGQLSRNDVLLRYLESDLFLIASVTDSLPTVVLEAMACGLPVIGSDVGGIPFMVKDGGNGVIVESNTPLAFANAIIDLSKKHEVRARMSKTGIDIVNRTFRWSIVGEQLQNIISDFSTQSSTK